ncbi:unnamed protein product [Darwinula stevensoni]|uniref:Afadin n=1 Tax=Darwinula stevensoni TaxID=69355 RepID=A0A7R8X7B5_9CRUS|nr:unnamed protein product [Darwinula stevensoni]CAG0888923.1 unnamed protein product [Darwinula stevensoni]
MDGERMRKIQEQEALRNIITQWNANRLDLFSLSEPNEDLEFHGVMRFYFQDEGQKVATKCIRVSSTATTNAVIQTLIEKFRPDMRMLTIPEYALYEIHENGEERRLGGEEKPLLVQLNWHKDDREGRFLLRRLDIQSPHFSALHGTTQKTQVNSSVSEETGSFKRKLSKREKKQLKKQEKLRRMKSGAENDTNVAEKLYSELPETSFTRSISNPEAVMRRRRQQKLEKKLQQFRSRDGGPDTGGTLKIYGDALCQDVPYKTLLLSVRDTAAYVVREMLDKYSLDKEDPANYCLVQIVTDPSDPSGRAGGTKEYILDEDECPLAILMTHQSERGSVTFHVKRRPADYQPRRRKKKTKPGYEDGVYRSDEEFLPYFLELHPGEVTKYHIFKASGTVNSCSELGCFGLNKNGSEIRQGIPQRYRLQLNVTEVGSERSSQTGGQSLQLFGPNVQSRHCVIAHMEGIVTVTPCSREAETYVNGQRIYETTLLQHGAVVRFGRHHTFRFLDPTVEERTRQPPLHHLRSSYTERMSSHEGSARGSMSRNFETTFDVDGNIETVSTASFRDDSRRSSRAWEGRSGGVRGHEAILPATLEFPEANEDAFLASLTTDLDVHNVHFKLAPTYTLYLAARYRASVHFRPDLTPPERAIKLTQVLSKAGRMVEGAIQAAGSNPPALSFWMANSSELLHFLKTDRHISAYSLDAQDILAECVQYGFRGLVTLLQGDVERCMPQVLDAHTEDSTLCMEGILGTLSHTMALLRTCRVNAALTIQLFSHLFHFVNMWLFNKLVIEGPLQLCSRFWGERLQQRLSHLEAWAEKQGLELAADCHLARITQAAHLLQAPKWTPEDIAGISAACFKLNSLQLCSLLERYQPAGDEPKIPQDLINNVVRVAESTADEILRSDGRPIKLEEDENLFLPFMLPEDGYSCDIVRGIPSGLTEFLAPLQHAGLCRFTPQPNSSGFWTIYMGSGEPVHARSPSAMSVRMSSAGDQVSPSGPQVVTIQLCKSNSGMGLSIVAAKVCLHFFIIAMVNGSSALVIFDLLGEDIGNGGKRMAYAFTPMTILNGGRPLLGK